MSRWYTKCDYERARVIASAVMEGAEKHERWLKWLETLSEAERKKEIARKKEKDKRDNDYY